MYTPNGENELYITKSGAFLDFEELDEKILKKIVKYFTLNYQKDEYRKEMKSYIMDRKNSRIILPRFGIFEVIQKYKLDYKTYSQLSEGLNININYKGKLTENQEIISKFLIENIYTKQRLRRGSAGCIINLEAGQGKSYLATYFINIFKKKTAIILHSTSLLSQWEKVIKETFENPNIGYYYGKKKTDGDIVLIIIDSACSDNFIYKHFSNADSSNVDSTNDDFEGSSNSGIIENNFIEYFNQFGFIIYDECHLYANNFSLKALKRAQAPYMMGLSATPDENLYGFDKIVWWELGEVINTKNLEGYKADTEEFNGIVHRIKYYGTEENTKVITESGANVISTIGKICEDELRKELIIKYIIEGLNLGLNLYVFADRREYLLEIQQLLEKKEILSNVLDTDKAFKRIVGGSTDDELAIAEKFSRVILTTYQYMGTGKSIVKMNGVILATPRKSKMKQYIGRIFRLGSDMNVTRHIWDICDENTMLSRQYYTRKKYYDEKGFSIETVSLKQ